MIQQFNRYTRFMFLLIVVFLLIFNLPPDVVSKETTEKKVDFQRDIQAIFVQNCVKCHGPDRQENDFRLDSPERLYQADVLAAGAPEESELYRRISLPPDDYDIMPPAEEGEPLTKSQISLIRRWISEGTDFGDWHPSETADEVLNLPRVPPAPPEAIRALEASGASVNPVAQNTALISVDFSSVAAQTTDEHLRLLRPVSEQVRWLNLARTQISDAGLGELAGLKNLTHLHLEKTEIGDAGLSHLKSLGALEYLNLYGTNVSDVGVESLATLPKLKRLFLWQTQVSEAGIERLRERAPDLDVNFTAPHQQPIGWSKPQLEAWNTLMKVWDFYGNKDWKKLEPHLHENWVGWFDGFDMPVNPTQWQTYTEESAFKNSEYLIWRITPIAVQVVDDVAVVHSTYYLSFVDKTTGEAERVEGRSVDTLKKSEETWKLLGTARSRSGR
jgi:mono/diheme cytochrome c family protein